MMRRISSMSTMSRSLMRSHDGQARTSRSVQSLPPPRYEVAFVDDAQLAGSPLQRAAVGEASGQAADQALPSDGVGKAMPADVQATMEDGFGRGLSGVRIHEGPRSKALGARAYTQGMEIHFAPGQYQPGSPSGQALLGHELAHVVQQAQGRVRATTQVNGVAVNDDSELEREADVVGARAARGAGASRKPLSSGMHGDAPAEGGAVVQRAGTGGDTSFRQKVDAMAPDDFFGEDFAQNHIQRVDKLVGQTWEEFARSAAKDRGLDNHTVLFMDKVSKNQLGAEIREKNASKKFYKEIKKRGNGVPADTIFMSDHKYAYVTVTRNGASYEVSAQGEAYLSYTVKNADTVDGSPIYQVNHLQEMTI